MRFNLSCRDQPRPSPFCRWSWAALVLAVIGGCGGNGDSLPRDASGDQAGDATGGNDRTVEPDGQDGPVTDGSGTSDVADPDSLADVPGPDAPVDTPPQPDLISVEVRMPDVGPPAPPPAVNPAARRLLPDGWELLGTHLSACSHGPASIGQRWCAISRTAQVLGRRELWLLNVTAATSATVACDVSNAACFKLTEELHASRPGEGPRYPEAHRFYGDTLIFYASARSGPADLFRGTALAWRPGWPAAKVISSNNASICRAHATAAVATCLENVTGLEEGGILQYDLHAGSLESGPLPKVVTLFPRHAQTQDVTAVFDFNRSGDTLLFSTPATPGSAVVAPVESLYFLKIADAGKLPPTQVAENVSRFALSADQTRWFYLRDYNYNTDGSPSGTLTTSDFPLGTNERRIQGPTIPSGSTRAVGAFQVLVDAAGLDAGIGLLVDVALGRGDYKILPRVDDPLTVFSVVAGSLGLPLPSPDGRFSIFSRTRSDNVATVDLNVIATDGRTIFCTLTGMPTGALFGVPFSGASSLVFWMDSYDQATDSGQGWVASPRDCSGKRMFARGIDNWFVKNEEMLVFSDDGDGQSVSLRVARINAGQLSPATLLQQGAGRTYAILPEWDAAIISLTTTTASVNGLYRIPLQ
jgi:hypothetical protein